jgi:flagellar biosynthetic protein FliR
VSGLEVAISQATLAGFLMALARAAGFVVTAPPFNTKGVPARVRAITAIVLALPLTAWSGKAAPSLTAFDLVLSGLMQLVVGAAFGFVVYLAVTTVQLVGDLIDVVGGFSMTMALDPLMLVQSSVMGRLHQLLAITLLFAGDGHLMIVHGLARGMQVLPHPVLDWSSLGEVVTHGLADMFLVAFQVAAPVVAVMIVSDVALGLLSRVAPALNAFALSFPLKLVLSLLLVALVVLQVPDVLTEQVSTAVVEILELTGAR